MDLLFLLNERIVLSDTFQCQLIHQVDLLRILQMFFLQRVDEVMSRWSRAMPQTTHHELSHSDRESG